MTMPRHTKIPFQYALKTAHKPRGKAASGTAAAPAEQGAAPAAGVESVDLGGGWREKSDGGEGLRRLASKNGGIRHQGI